MVSLAWNAQGDPAHAPFREAFERAFGCDMPEQANTAARPYQGLSALWLGPRSWLLIGGTHARGAAGKSPTDLPPPDALTAFTASRDALNAAGGALFDVTASRVAFRISGTPVTNVLAGHCPLDFHGNAFAPRTVQQSLFGHVNALFLRAEDGDAFTIMVARSFAHDVWQALCASSASYGYEVVAPAAMA